MCTKLAILEFRGISFSRQDCNILYITTDFTINMSLLIEIRQDKFQYNVMVIIYLGR